MKYYLIAGEASGDLHGANLMKAILKNDPQAVFRFWGGDNMRAVGGTLVKHYRDLAFMGFVEVFMNIRTVLKNLSFCKKDLSQFAPDVVVLIDYPGFNLRIAKFAHQQGLKTVFYISPTVWAWKQSRVQAVKKYVDRMLVILPFEKDFYARFHVKADFVGHPLLDVLAKEKRISREEFLEKNHLSEKPVVAVLPGSRQQEIYQILPGIARITSAFSSYQFVIAGVTSVPKSVYAHFNIPVVFDQTHALLRHAEAAVVASGTATLETALLNVPQVVVYKMNGLTYFLAKQFVHLRFISLVNLILGKEAVKELIQKDFSAKNLTSALHVLLEDEEKRKQMLSDYTLLKTLLGKSGASEKAAAVIGEVLESMHPAEKQP
jgi:lipid-A-disaccharide synthase